MTGAQIYWNFQQVEVHPLLLVTVLSHPLGGISLGRGRGIPRNSSLPRGTQEFLGKGRGQMPEKFLKEPRNSLIKFLQSSFA